MGMFDTVDLPWLRQPNPGEFMLQSEQAAASIGANFARGMEFGQKAKQDAAMFPIRQKLAEQQAQEGALDIASKIQMNDLAVKQKEAMPAFAETIKKITDLPGAWADPNAPKFLSETAVKYPWIVDSPMWKNAEKNIETAGAQAVKLRDAETRANKAQSQADIGFERNELQRQQMSLKDEQLKAERESKEKMATEKNATTLENTRLKLDAKARDVLPEMAYRKFSEAVRSIYRDPILKPEEKDQKAQKMLDDEAAKLKSVTKPTASSEEKVRVIAPGGATGTVPKSMLEDALKNGFKRAQ